jgi:DHA1 family tetracycline resistance protein-like MFS transporter
VGLIASRFFAGVAAGNAAVMQASMADLSVPEERAKRFGWLGASFGIGFIMGPFLGGKLSEPYYGFSYATPFWGAALLALINLLLAIWCFVETRPQTKAASLNPFASIAQLRDAFKARHLRVFFGVMFMYFFGWELFMVFCPVFLMSRFEFSNSQIGNFYAYVGLWFVISNGLLMRWAGRLSPITVLRFAFPLWGLALLILSQVHSNELFWIALAPVPGIGAIIFSTGSALVSNLSKPEMQGEALGMYQSVQAAALAFPPLCFGSLVTLFPLFPVFGGTFCVLVAAFVWWSAGPKKLLLPQEI